MENESFQIFESCHEVVFVLCYFQGKLGVFSLELINNPNGTFEIMPGVGQQKVMFVIHVRNSELLDYESRRSISFKILAKEVANSSLSDTADVLVYIDDVNDNVPQFAQAEYRVTLPENVTAGTTVTQVSRTIK